ncbi:MAG TPA: CoA-transferase subunit beta [Thermoleophilaceae bacterium]|nr:CoA-transferase subunit beta [Thermoleophilaceae bacterium]
MSEEFTADEAMTVAAARELTDRTVCFVGIGLPSTAANLARLTHAPRTVLVYESGTIGSKPTTLPLSIGDGELAETADSVVSVPEIFNYWLQGGWIDVGFLGAAQIDARGRLNSTVIGDYDRPKVRLPGAGGAPEIAALAKDIIVIMRQSPRAFVEKLDFRSSAGSPSVVITDLGLLRPDPGSGELTQTQLHPGVTAEQAREATGWDLKLAADLNETEPPSDEELSVLRDLKSALEQAA